LPGRVLLYILCRFINGRLIELKNHKTARFAVSDTVKIRIAILLLFTWLLFYMPGYADEPVSSQDSAISNELPEWSKRIYYGLKIETGRKPFFYFETVQPLRRLKEDDWLIFTHPRITIKDGIGYYSLGLGYRRLFGLDMAILGFNVFYDYRQRRHHQVGLGAEALGNDLEARINYYFGTSDVRLVEETATYFKYEEVLDGLDAEIGFRVPGLPWMKVFGGGYYYDANYARDLEGWKTRLELKPSRFLTFDIGVRDDNSSDERWFMEAQFRIPFGDEKGYASKPVLRTRMLEPVERNFIPTVEKWTSDRTGTITGRILDQNNDPVIDARVEIHSEVVTVYTDSNGEFSATVPAGDHTLYAWNSDGEPIITAKAITVGDGTTLNLAETVNGYFPKISNLTAEPAIITDPPNKSWIRFDGTDADGDDITWSASITGFIPDDPDDNDQGSLSPTVGGTIHHGSGKVRYVARDAGTATITVSLNDGNGGTDSASIDIVVE